MIENVETYCCEEYGCGRKFEVQERLLDHYKRRHENLFLKSTNKNEDKSKKLLNELYNKINDIENDAGDLMDYEDIEREVGRNIHQYNDEGIYSDIEDNENFEKSSKNISQNNNESNSITNSISLSNSQNISVQKVTVITDEMIGIGSRYSDYDEIDEINLHERKIYCFRTKTNINFTYFLYVTTINLSNNYIKDISHIKHFTTVKFLNISSNKIDDISELENLEYLETLDAENNEINSISTLNKCRNLQTLNIADNKIKYESSTYKTIQNLNKLRELSIKNNPFLYEVFGYRHLFICKYPRISKLDKEDIKELDREVAVKFTQENSLTNNDQTERPHSAVEVEKPTTNTNTNTGVNSMNRTVANIKDKIISKIEYKPPKVIEKQVDKISVNSITSSNKKLPHLLKVIKKGVRTNSLGKEDDKLTAFKQGNPVRSLQTELEELRNENKMLADKNKSYEMEMQSLKAELENSTSLVKEYEKIIQEAKKDQLLFKDGKDDDEKRKLKNELELWKREYCGLLDKSMSTNVSTSRLLTNGPNDKFRPQTAQVKGKKDSIDRYNPYERSMEDLSNFKNESMRIKRKNSLDDSLNHSDSNEEEERQEPEDSDNEIDDLLRKSVTNLSTLKTEIKVLSKATDQNRNNVKNTKEEQIKNRSLSKPRIMKDTIEVKNKLFNININKK